MRSAYSFWLSEWEELIQAMYQPAFRAKQIWQGLYRQHYRGWDDFGVLPKALRDSLKNDLCIGSIDAVQTIQSKDGYTAKTVFQLKDRALVETVLMGYNTRNTVCVSTQVGCAAGCKFCATGQMGLSRNLDAAEILEQILYFERLLQKENRRVTNVVFMGMGEPFHNYDQVMKAVRILHHPEGFNMGERHFTISTVGIVPEIERFTQEKTQINLAISLHSADNEIRSSIIPINRRYPLYEVMNACRNYIAVTRRRVTFEYALIEGVNDSEQQAKETADLLRHMLCHVNLILLNPTKQYSKLPPGAKTAEMFQAVLTSGGIPCTIRLRRGIEIQAGCGQLATQTRKNDGL